MKKAHDAVATLGCRFTIYWLITHVLIKKEKVDLISWLHSIK